MPEEARAWEGAACQLRALQGPAAWTQGHPVQQATCCALWTTCCPSPWPALCPWAFARASAPSPVLRQGSSVPSRACPLLCTVTAILRSRQAPRSQRGTLRLREGAALPWAVPMHPAHCGPRRLGCGRGQGRGATPLPRADPARWAQQLPAPGGDVRCRGDRGDSDADLAAPCTRSPELLGGAGRACRGDGDGHSRAGAGQEVSPRGGGRGPRQEEAEQKVKGTRPRTAAGDRAQTGKPGPREGAQGGAHSPGHGPWWPG